MFLCPLSIDFAAHTWLAEWISGIGQALGAAFTFGAVYVALRSERRIDDRRRQDAEDAELADARLISVHVTLTGHRQQPPGTAWWQVALRNDSPGVITNVQLEKLKIDGKPVPKWKVDAGAGLVTGPPKFKSQEVPWLEPHKAMQWVVWCLNDEGESVSFPDGEREAVVRFVRDGWTWSRSDLGAPQRFRSRPSRSLLNPRPKSNTCASLLAWVSGPSGTGTARLAPSQIGFETSPPVMPRVSGTRVGLQVELTCAGQVSHIYRPCGARLVRGTGTCEASSGQWPARFASGCCFGFNTSIVGM